LFKILFHVIHHHRRKWFNLSLFKEGDDFLEDTLVYEAPIAQDLNDEEVLAAMDKIPQHYREIVLLADVEELAYKEIADALNIPVGTVMSRLSRGRKLLRKELSGFAESYGIKTAQANGGGL
jgi:RNA polymerase sigma-70 factor (ECF subfamily)